MYKNTIFKINFLCFCKTLFSKYKSKWYKKLLEIFIKGLYNIILNFGLYLTYIIFLQTLVLHFI